MKIKNVVGYMLGTDYDIYARGDQWSDRDALVYVCCDIRTAQRIMRESNHPMHDGKRWTTIYRVHAPSLDCNTVRGDKLWTNQATKIIVDGPVAYHNAKEPLTAKVLRARAALIVPRIHNLINNMDNIKER